MKKSLKLWLSADPNQRFSRKSLQSPLIEAVRCNTGAPVISSKEQILKEFQNDFYPIQIWVDLKCRELRIVKDAIIPRDYLELNHTIEVKTPTTMYYNEGKNSVIIDQINGETKIHVKPPKNFTGSETIKFGKGASLNIPDDSLKIHDYLTKNDKEYVEAAKKIGIHNYLLSFVENVSDINELLNLDQKANIVAKIESKKGLKFVNKEYQTIQKDIRLLAARADLYIELDKPHEILKSLKLIIQKDPNAIAGSRLLESFVDLQKIPSCADFTDIGYLLEIGYNNFLLGDDICSNEMALNSAIGVFNAIFE